MKTTAYVVKELAKGVFEIGEFDCGSMFLIVGKEKALLIDAGIGIGDIRAAVQKLTDKPVTLVLTHSHLDHIGNAPAFEAAYISKEDLPVVAQGGGVNVTLDKRKQYAGFIAGRSGLTYDYDLDVDMQEWDGSNLDLIPIEDGHVFDLGGRKVTAYACPGHTPGSMVLLDDQSRILFLGDALNCNLLLGGTTIERALGFLERLEAMGDSYDCFYNGHYDYRPCGEPLDACVLPDAIAACRALVGGNYKTTLVPSPLPIFPDREMMVVGKAMIAFDPERILEPK